MEKSSSRSFPWPFLAPAALLVLNLLLFGCFAIYSGNPGEFQFSFLEILAWLGPFGIVVGVLLVMAAWPQSAQSRRVYYVILLLPGVMTYVHGNLLYWDTGVLDGNALDVENPWRSATDVVLWLVLGGLAWRFRHWLIEQGWKICAVLVLFQAIGVVSQSWGRSFEPQPFSDIPDQAVEFSVQNNVLHIILDGFQASIFEHLVEKAPALAEDFSGFTFFRDTLTASDVTYLSVPASLSAVAFTNETTISDYHQQTLEGTNLYTFLSSRGFSVDVATPVWWNQSNDAFASYYRIPTPYSDYRESLRSTALLLFDLSLFRQAPHFAKALVYGGGAWMLSRWMVREPEQQFEHFAHNRFLRELTDRITVVDSGPRYKFLHLVTPHAPLVTNSDCGFTGNELAYGLETSSAQSQCTLANVVGLLDELKSRGLYDQSLIVIHGDHGGGVPFSMRGRDGQMTDSSRALHRVWGNPLPLLLVKPPGAQGSLEVSDREVILTDIPATVADLLGLENPFPGESVFKPESNGSRPRFFYHSTIHRNEAYAKDRFDDFSSYVVRGSIYDLASWTEGEHYEAPGYIEQEPYAWGTPIRFGRSGTFKPYKKGGWGNGRTGKITWTDGPKAEFSIPLPQTTSAIRMRLKAKPMIVPGKLDKQRVTILVNGQELAQWTLTEGKVTSLEALVPPDFLKPGESTVFTLLLPDARSPESMQAGRDLRELGLGFTALQFDLEP